MKKFKAILALVLVAALFVTLFAACAKTEEKPNTDTNTNTNTNTGSNDKEPAGDTNEPAGDTDEPATYDPEDVVDIEIYFVQFTNTVEEWERVQAAINAITEPEIGVRVKLQLFEFGEYPTQLGLMMSSGENVDIAYMSFGAAGYGSLYSAGQLMDIRALMDEYAPDMKEVLGPYAETYAISGGIYALPPYRAYNMSGYIIMREDILQELNMVEYARNMKTWAEVEQLWQTVKDNYDNLWPTCTTGCQELILSGSNLADAISYDRLGDAQFLVSVADGKVVSHVERPEYVEQLKRAKDWMDKGYVWPDLLISDEMGDNVIRQGVAFSEFMPSEYGVESAKTQACGYDMFVTEIAPMMVCSSNVQKFGLCVPVVSDEPEAAMRFLNMFYTDKRINMLMTYGEEGKDYVITDAGEAAYPAGVEASTVGFHVNDFLVGNQFLITPWEGAGADQRELAKAMMDTAPVSPYLGFTFDSAGQDNLIAGLTAVVSEYSKTLGSGGYTEELYQNYIDKLYNSDLQDYIDLYQTQLDAWQAGK